MWTDLDIILLFIKLNMCTLNEKNINSKRVTTLTLSYDTPTLSLVFQSYTALLLIPTCICARMCAREKAVFLQRQANLPSYRTSRLEEKGSNVTFFFKFKSYLRGFRAPPTF